MYTEDELLPLSALQHLVFCERQCALIHLEQIWAENRLTAEGRLLHEKADSQTTESRGDLRIVRSLSLTSLRLGLSGRADAVEFHRVMPDRMPSASAAGPSSAVTLADAPGWWRPFPVEYKRGQPKPHRADEVQLCAQAFCLEEHFGIEIPAGALYYHKPRRRQAVTFDVSLRDLTASASERLHVLLRSGKTPPAVREPKCGSCSLLGLCLPSAGSHSARAYLTQLFQGKEVQST